ncbi:hypothetical protein [Nocardioides rubriscoriae]|uniref:hypothetical protein n=1 Tax=Nocardioides rubriscoriae TaxID=642762 RepID=UPI0011DF894C|nr:hypothetical protein [Nocardioides rubriscoriae]
MHTATRVAGVVAGLTMTFASLGAVPASYADEAAGDPAAAPCADQQAQVDRAEDALARVTAVFAKQQARVKKAKDDVEAADTPREEKRAERALAKAKDARAEAKQTKRAQQQRVARAQARLDACQAEQPTEQPAP